MKNQYIFKMQNVSVAYDDFEALHCISMTAQPGDFIALVGANGAGKSTFLNALMGLLTPKSGCIDFNEERIHLENPLASIGFSSQKLNMDWYLNVWNNVFLGCAFAGIGGKRARELTKKALHLVHLEGEADSLLDTLSGGQQQRVQIGRAIVHEPQIYILDEPTTGLDADVAENFFQYLEEEHKIGKTIIVSSHDLYLLEKYCTKLLFLEKGNLVYWGGMKEFLDQYQPIQRYRVTTGGDFIPDIGGQYRHFTLELENEEDKNKFIMIINQDDDLSTALVELSQICQLDSFQKCEESSLREFFIRRGRL